MGADDQNVKVGIMGAGSGRPPASPLVAGGATLMGAWAGPDRPRVPVRPDRAGAHRHGTEPGPWQARRHDMRSLPRAGGGANEDRGSRAGRVGSTIGRLWHAAGDDVTFAARLQDPDSPLWINILTHDEATALVARIKSGDTAAADQSALRTRVRELAAPFEKLRDHAPDDPAFFLEHLSRSVFEAGINWRVVEAKWDGIREAFHGFDPAQVAAMPPAEIAARMTAA